MYPLPLSARLILPSPLQFEYSEQLWPWSGYLALYLRVKEEGRQFAGIANGEFRFVVSSPPRPGSSDKNPQRSIVRVNVTTEIIPTPPRCGTHGRECSPQSAVPRRPALGTVRHGCVWLTGTGCLPALQGEACSMGPVPQHPLPPGILPT